MAEKFFILCFSAIFWISVSGQSVDLTIVSGAKSEAVVDATIQRLTMIPGLFTNDYGILKRIALVESNYGDNTNGAPGGGIWQITNRIYTALQTSALANAIILRATIPDELKEYFDLGSTRDFSVPIRSAFAARLFIEISINAPLTTLPEQADYWAGTYNLVAPKEFFFQLVEQNEDTVECTIQKLDLYFLVDGSGSVSTSNFALTLDFVNATSYQFIISPDRVWTALTVFSSSPNLISGFGDDITNSAFESAIDGVVRPGGGTATSVALVSVNNIFETQARPQVEGVPKILVVLTDGRSNRGVQPGANMVKDSGVIVYAVGVGSGFDQNEINEIASGPQYAFAISDFANLVASLTNSLQTQACLAPVMVQNSTTVAIDIQPSVPRYTEVQLVIGGSVTIFITNANPDADIVIFISSSVMNPSGAIYDITLTLGQGNWEIVINDAGNGNFDFGLFIRNRRQAPGDSMPLFITMQSDSPEPTSISFRSVTTDTPANLPNMQTSGRLCYSLKRKG